MAAADGRVDEEEAIELRRTRHPFPFQRRLISRHHVSIHVPGSAFFITSAHSYTY